MAYERINWQNGEVGNTPLNANNLNRMDMTLEEHDQKIGDHDYEIENLKTGEQGITEEINKKMDRINPQGSGTLSIQAVNADNITAQTVEADEIKVTKVGSKDGTAPVVFDNDILVNGITTPIGSLASSASDKAESASERAEDAYNLASRANREAASAINLANDNKAKIDLHTGLIGEGVGDKVPIPSYTDGYYIAPDGRVTQYNATATLIKIEFLDFFFRGDNIIFNHVDLLPTENCIPCAWYDISGNFISAADGLNIIAEIDEQTFKITKHYIDYCIIPVPAGASSCKLSGLANGRADIRIQTSLSEAIKDLQSKPEPALLVLTNPSPLPATDGKKILGIDALGKSWQDGTPTPENAIPITDASNEVTAHTKNLVPYTVKSGTFNDVAYTISNDGTVTLNGKASASGTLDFFRSITEIPPDWEKGKKYIFGAKFINNTNVGDAHFDTYPYINGAWDTGNDVVLNDTGEVEWTIPNNAVGFLCCIGTQGGKTYDNLIIKPYIYEAYNTTTLPFDPKSVGSVANEFIIYEDGTGKIIQRVGAFAPTTAEQYGADANNGNYCLIRTPKNALANMASVVGIADKLVGKSYNDRHSDINISRLYRGNAGYNNAFWIQLAKGDTTFTSSESAVAFAKTLTIYYALATPIEISLTAEEVAAVRQLMTYKGNTFINSEMDVKSVTYPGDIKAYVDGKFNYSYTVRKIGKWADNKDLYQIVVNTVTPNAGADGMVSNLVTSNNCSIKRISGIVKSGNTYSPISDYYNTLTYNSIWVDGGGIKMHSSQSDYYANKPCEITVEYTLNNETPTAASVMSLDETEE